MFVSRVMGEMAEAAGKLFKVQADAEWLCYRHSLRGAALCLHMHFL